MIANVVNSFRNWLDVRWFRVSSRDVWRRVFTWEICSCYPPSRNRIGTFIYPSTHPAVHTYFLHTLYTTHTSYTNTLNHTFQTYFPNMLSKHAFQTEFPNILSNHVLHTNIVPKHTKQTYVLSKQRYFPNKLFKIYFFKMFSEYTFQTYFSSIRCVSVYVMWFLQTSQHDKIDNSFR